MNTKALLKELLCVLNALLYSENLHLRVNDHRMGEHNTYRVLKNMKSEVLQVITDIIDCGASSSLSW